MIIGFDDLKRYRHKVAMVDGCFDPLHRGHIDYFREAAKLGFPVLCNVMPDEYVETKHPPLLTQEHRAAIIDAIRYISFTHMSRVSTAEVLRELRPKAYVKGSDWTDRLPPEQVEIAQEYRIEVVYLNTVSDSSQKILDRFLANATATERSRHVRPGAL